MIYKLNLTAPSPLSSVPITGAVLRPSDYIDFVPWEPSAWPAAPVDDHEFLLVLKRIFELSMLLEISGVIEDATARTGSLIHRGHVVAISLLCAVDAISSYGYGARSGKQIPPFVSVHFPVQYQAHAATLLNAYRHAMVHSWNLFSVAISPGSEEIKAVNGIVSFGLLNFFEAIKYATSHFLEQARQEPVLMHNARLRYEDLRSSAKAVPKRQ